jgi:hypothetical protein
MFSQEPYVYDGIKDEKGNKCVHPSIRYNEIESVNEDIFGNKIIKSRFQVSDELLVKNPISITNSTVNKKRYIKIKDDRLKNGLEEKLVSWKI